MKGFGFLLKLEFLQNWASVLIARLNPHIVHNLAKYYAIKKIHSLSTIEDMDGDYLEFGIFTGSSFCHSIRCFKASQKKNPDMKPMSFYGFDSFKGFGPIDEEDKHPFFTDVNFDTDKATVERRVRKVAGNIPFYIIPGFFDDSLKNNPENLGLRKARVIFVDSDTYKSAKAALDFCAPIVQVGTFIALDDSFHYRGREDRGVRRAFCEFVRERNIEARVIFTYGLGGIVFIISKIG